MILWALLTYTLSAEGFRFFFYDAMKKKMFNELSVSSVYRKSAAIFCPPAALFLEFYSRHKACHARVDGGDNRHYAIPDSFLQFLKLSEHDDSVRLDEETERLLHNIAEEFESLAVWELRVLRKSCKASKERRIPIFLLRKLHARMLPTVSLQLPGTSICWSRCRRYSCHSRLK